MWNWLRRVNYGGYNFELRVVQYSDLTGVYLYKLDDRWRVSPNYENKKSWFFTDKGVKTLTKDTKFYHGDDSSYKIYKSKFRVATLENVRDTCKFKCPSLSNSPADGGSESAISKPLWDIFFQFLHMKDTREWNWELIRKKISSVHIIECQVSSVIALHPFSVL